MSTARTLRLILAALATIAALLTLPALATAQGDPPVIRDGNLDPSSLGHDGGTVNISVQIDAEAEPITTDAEVVGPNGSFSVRLSTAFGGHATGSVDIPANFTPDPVSWSVEIHAADGNGSTASDFIGFVEVAGEPQFDEPPDVYDASVSPASVPSGGGNVALAVSASDLGGITEARANVVRPDGTVDTVALEQISETRFTGTYAAPANTTTSRRVYGVSFTAADDTGQETNLETAGFSVAAALGKLKASVRSLHFGDVKVGRIATRWFFLENTGAEGTPPLTVTLSSSHARFSVAGASTFTLAPGETRAVPVVFRPTSAGARSGRISVTRSDRRQPGLGVDVEGSGIP